MPEGHSIHRIARQFHRNFVGHEVAASSPQGRFVEGAALLDGREVTTARAVGKQLFLGFDDQVWLRVHLGIYGAWDFAGQIEQDAVIAAANGRMGQTGQRGIAVDAPAVEAVRIFDTAGENSVSSIGAPRRTRMRMSEQTSAQDAEEAWPPLVVGQVRLRMLTATACADLRGPTTCQIQTPDEMLVTLAGLGPDPLDEDVAGGQERFTAAVRRRSTPIGLLLMDQSVLSGVGNVYRAELLFRAGIDPHTPGRSLTEETLHALWQDAVRLLRIGVATGVMMTMNALTDEQYRRALADRDDRHWVYRRAGLPCRACGTAILLEQAAGRKLYWCPRCQA